MEYEEHNYGYSSRLEELKTLLEKTKEFHHLVLQYNYTNGTTPDQLLFMKNGEVFSIAMDTLTGTKNFYLVKIGDVVTSNRRKYLKKNEIDYHYDYDEKILPRTTPAKQIVEEFYDYYKNLEKYYNPLRV